MTRRIARSLGDSWASCSLVTGEENYITCYLDFFSFWIKTESPDGLSRQAITAFVDWSKCSSQIGRFPLPAVGAWNYWNQMSAVEPVGMIIIHTSNTHTHTHTHTHHPTSTPGYIHRPMLTLPLQLQAVPVKVTRDNPVHRVKWRCRVYGHDTIAILTRYNALS